MVNLCVHEGGLIISCEILSSEKTRQPLRQYKFLGPNEPFALELIFNFSNLFSVVSTV